METITVSPGQMQQMMMQSGDGQVLQVLSLKDAQMLTKAMGGGVEVKEDVDEKMYTIK